MQRTKIEYLTHTWNPIAMRCTPVSDGCRNCWHLAMAKRLAGNHMIGRDAQRAYAGIDGPSMNHVELDAPLNLKKPAKIGCQFMGDLFHPEISFDVLTQFFVTIALSERHQFFILTKRPSRFGAFVTAWESDDLGSPTAGKECRQGFKWPLPNVWFGVSCEDQKTADERIPILLQIPASHYFVSHEPGLGMITYPREYLALGKRIWLITGGETGPGARPMHPDIPRHDRDQCQSAGLPFFFKSWGEWLHDSQAKEDLWPPFAAAKDVRGNVVRHIEYGGYSYRIGKKKAGRLLDGKIWEEYP